MRSLLCAGAFALALALAPPARAQAEGDVDAITVRSERGPVSATLALRPKAPHIGDALELELRVEAQPGVELLMPEFGEALGRFQIVDFRPSRAVDDAGRNVEIQRYTLAPTLSGEQRVPPLLVEFVDHRPGQVSAPADEDAYELLTDALDFSVSSTLADGAPLELRPAQGELGPLRMPGESGVRVAGFVAAAVALAVAVLLWRRFAARGAQESAYARARRELAALQGEPLPAPADRDGVDAFFVTLSSIVRRYIEGRFALNSPELTTEEFLAALQRSPDLLRSHQELLAELLGEADLVKFAQHTPDAAVLGRSLEIAERFLEATREADDAPSDGASIEDGEAPRVRVP